MQKITGRKRFFVPSQSGHWEARDWLLSRAWPGPVQGQSSEPTPGGPVASPELWAWAGPGSTHSAAGASHLRSGPPFPHLSPLRDICDLRPIAALSPQGPGLRPRKVPKRKDTVPASQGRRAEKPRGRGWGRPALVGLRAEEAGVRRHPEPRAGPQRGVPAAAVAAVNGGDTLPAPALHQAPSQLPASCTSAQPPHPQQVLR